MAEDEQKKNLIAKLLEKLGSYCDEFLVHAVDVEGKSSGIEKECCQKQLGKLQRYNAVTYAGGIHSMKDISFIREKGNGRVDFTIGSALDLFGGK